jgi:hypothetical protein
VSGFIDRLASYDALDRAEVLASIAFLARKKSLSSEELVLMLSKQLMSLPFPVTRQLQRLGILDFAIAFKN